MKKVLPILLIILGLALLLGAGAFWLDALTSDEPASLGTTIRDWLTLLAGLGASIKGWLDLFKNDKSAPPATHIEVSGGNPQIATGGNAHNIQTGSGDYLERGDKIEVHLPPPPRPRDSIGYIPPAKAVTYIHRGVIEDEVRAFLRSGDRAGAIVGLHAPGGLGKTELAKHVAEEMKDQFDGRLWVDVGEKTPPQVIADSLSSAVYRPGLATPTNSRRPNCATTCPRAACWSSWTNCARRHSTGWMISCRPNPARPCSPAVFSKLAA
ncbi:MAG: hypothetical protein C0393_05305 [Anaerolinea sp.]|nr:hypothetical protein [Anaerolinea sp.]